MTRSQPTIRPPQPLTPNEKRVLEYIETYISRHGLSPSYQEIKDHFGFASFNSIQRYLKQLENKGYLHIPGENKKRAITLLHSATALQSSLKNLKASSSASETLSLPLLGRVAAGLPIEEIEQNEFFEVPAALVRSPSTSFALRVKGQSMVEDGILDGDIILVQRQDHASNGEIVVALIENEATVKRFYSHHDPRSLKLINSGEKPPRQAIELRPANSTMSSLWYRPEEVRIQGVLIGLIRQF